MVQYRRSCDTGRLHWLLGMAMDHHPLTETLDTVTSKSQMQIWFERLGAVILFGVLSAIILSAMIQWLF